MTAKKTLPSVDQQSQTFEVSFQAVYVFNSAEEMADHLEGIMDDREKIRELGEDKDFTIVETTTTKETS